MITLHLAVLRNSSGHLNEVVNHDKLLNWEYESKTIFTSSLCSSLSRVGIKYKACIKKTVLPVKGRWFYSLVLMLLSSFYNTVYILRFHAPTVWHFFVNMKLQRFNMTSHRQDRHFNCVGFFFLIHGIHTFLTPKLPKQYAWLLFGTYRVLAMFRCKYKTTRVVIQKGW